MSKHKVTLVPLKETIEVDGDKDLFSQLKKQGYPIQSTCGGVASCARCIVVVLEGKESLSDPTFEEKQLLGNVFHITGERLSCQMKIHGDITLDISSHIASQETVRPKTVRKTKDQVQDERQKRFEEREKQKQEEFDLTKKHTQNKDFGKVKKLGGSKRPKSFHYRNPSED